MYPHILRDGKVNYLTPNNNQYIVSVKKAGRLGCNQISLKELSELVQSIFNNQNYRWVRISVHASGVGRGMVRGDAGVRF